jgi:hypothetical protein
MKFFKSKQKTRLIFTAVLLFWCAVFPPAFASVETGCREVIRVYGMEMAIAERFTRDCMVSRGVWLPVSTESAEIGDNMSYLSMTNLLFNKALMRVMAA